jgi:hypothetical protein
MVACTERLFAEAEGAAYHVQSNMHLNMLFQTAECRQSDTNSQYFKYEEERF